MKHGRVQKSHMMIFMVKFGDLQRCYVYYGWPLLAGAAKREETYKAKCLHHWTSGDTL